ncbi:hypothetical protein CC1G_03333 [Coprinopsis cinerea okayama7|uniref:Uncharacterized protein n=1 Tax=Coprinopsis cinerea (strain Okayama-7 / 130 / ATCC MYA-4618 / FGSC 9003) TaxID=240176 RepID=A8N7J0_COPC7|nr:hypothetical protein CC1G_03333 [Coprinopsis cinerea okayama7\|eukprot:XP_001830796.2 hypothetical protein CC1G_03333 [Coprinopsis cinerea okayama7\
MGGLGLRLLLSGITRYHSPLADHAFSYKDDLSSTLFNIQYASRASFKLTTVLVGLWEGIVTLHYLKKMPNSWDPYIAYGVRLFIDLIVTESIERLVVVVIWTGLGMVLADVTPGIWREVGLHRIWRRTRRDLYTISRIVEKGVPKVALPPLPRVRVVRFSGEDREEEARAEREREREERRRERRERRAEAEAARQIEEDEEDESISAPVTPSILQPPSSTIETATVASARRRTTPAAQSELASILDRTPSASTSASTSAVATPVIATVSSSRSREREFVVQREPAKERERFPIGLPTPDTTVANARPTPSRSVRQFLFEDNIPTSPTPSTTSTTDLDFSVDDDLDDDNRSSSAASFTAASSPFTSASNLTPRIELLSPPGSEYDLQEPDTPQFTGQRLQFLDTAMDNAPEVDAEFELMSDIAAEEEMLAIAGGTGKYDDDYDDEVATPRARHPYLPPTPSDSAARFSVSGRRPVTMGRRDLPPADESASMEEEEHVVVPPAASLEQIPDDEPEPPKEQTKEERPPTPPAKDDIPAGYRSPPPTAAAKLKSSSSKKAASSIGVRPSEKPKKSSKSKSVVSEGAQTPQLGSFTTQFNLPAPAPAPTPPPISVATSGLQVPNAPVGVAMITPVSADRDVPAANVPAPQPQTMAPQSYMAGSGVPVPPTPGTLLGGFGNPGITHGYSNRYEDDRSTVLPPAYEDWTGHRDSQEEEEDDMYLDEETSRIHTEAYRQALEAETEASRVQDVPKKTYSTVSRRTSPPKEPAPVQQTVAPVLTSEPAPMFQSPPISPVSPLAPTWGRKDEPPKDRKGRSGRGSIENKRTEPVKSLVNFWAGKDDAGSVIGTRSDIGPVGGRRPSISRAAGSMSTVGTGTRAPLDTSAIYRPSSKSKSRSNSVSRAKTKEQQEEEDEAARVAAAAIASAEALIAQQRLEDEEEERERRRKRELAEEEERKRVEKEMAEAAAEVERLRLEEEERQRKEEEERLRLEAEERARKAEEERLAQEAEEQARREEEERLAREAEEKARQEEEERLAREAEEQARREEEERLAREAEERARREEEERLAREAAEEKARLEEEERQRLAREAEEKARQEEEARLAKEAEEAAAAEAKRIRKEEKKRRKAEEKARKEAEEAAAAEAERKRLEEEEAERERQRIAAEEAAEEERRRQEEERLREEEEERKRKAQEEEQERRWKLEMEERERLLAEEAEKKRKEEEAAAAEEEKKRLEAEAAAEEEKRKAEEAAKAEKAAASEKGSTLSFNRNKELPPIVDADADNQPPSVFGSGLDVNKFDKGPYDAFDDPFSQPNDGDVPTTPTQETTNLAGIGAGGRSDLGRARSEVQQREASPAPVITVDPGSANASMNADADADAEGEAEGEGNDQDALGADGDDLASVSVATSATAVSADIEKRMQKTFSLRAQKTDVERRLEEIKAKNAPEDVVKATERVLRKYEKKLRRYYEDCQQHSFYYSHAPTDLLLMKMSPEVARDHINETLLWHIVPDRQSFAFRITLPPTNNKAGKALKAAILRHLEDELNIKPVTDRANGRVVHVTIDENEFDEWVAEHRRAATAGES